MNVRSRAAAVAAAVAFGASLGGCSPTPPSGSSATAAPSAAAAPSASAPSPSPRPVPTVEPIHGVAQGAPGQRGEITETDASGRVVYDIRYTTVILDRRSDGTTISDLTKPTIVFHDKSKRQMTAVAPKAVAYQKSKTIVMTGGVRAKSDDGTVLTCDQMTYDGAKDSLHGVGDVVLTDTSGRKAYGASITSDTHFEHVMMSATP